MPLNLRFSLGFMPLYPLFGRFISVFCPDCKPSCFIKLTIRACRAILPANEGRGRHAAEKRLTESAFGIGGRELVGQDFIDWVETSCHFCDTLVDRIVPGFPREQIDEIKEEIGYDDNLVVRPSCTTCGSSAVRATRR